MRTKKQAAQRKIKEVGAWAHLMRWPSHPTEIELTAIYSTLLAARRDFGKCYGASKGLAPSEWFIPVRIVPVTKAKRRKK